MGAVVLVLGRSGTGKSTSLRNFKPGEIGVLNVMSKPLPVDLGENDVFDTDDYKTIQGVLLSGKRNAWVVDDAGYLMQLENFRRSGEKGYEKFTEMAYNFEQVIMAGVKAPKDTITYVMMHTDHDVTGAEKPRTIGKMIDEKFCIEGACTTVLNCQVRDGKHVFVTQSDGVTLAKVPYGLDVPEVMDNDLKEVDTKLREKWHLAPLAAAKKTTKSTKGGE